MTWFDRSIIPPRIVEIFSIDIDESNLRRLTEDKALKTLITCNNSNQYLFYTRENDDYESELWFIDIVSLIAKPVQSVPSWSIGELKVSINGNYLFFI